MQNLSDKALAQLSQDIRKWGQDLGFDAVGISPGELSGAGAELQNWLQRGWHGEMDFMSTHVAERTHPDHLVPNTCRIISVRLGYWHDSDGRTQETLWDPEKAYIARYALGRDYHRPMRRRLQKLADQITEKIGPFSYRAFADSAPVMEKPLGQAARLGWIGKHTNLIDTQTGSWFFLGELYTDLPLPVDPPHPDHCGTCSRCSTACPTGALDIPYKLDARRCIAYLTIEHKTAIPESLRGLIGNRVFGCDDCQLVCPHNGSPKKGDPLFAPRHGLADPELVEVFLWSAEQFEQYTNGSPLRRLGYERWMRNVAVALGNGISTAAATDALRSRLGKVSAMVDEHIIWALQRLGAPDASTIAGQEY
ncbi:MAG TPA: tRNA epoxyqueuosine(34) reductase QueG [Gammaproteobacteria bacterium]|nr:tRNA epoxyqueuosine(34) reductase QueG [Gammaproteobacteria bacterium]